MTTAPPVRVLIVDDQPLVRGGFRMLVDSQPDLTVVGDVDDGVAAVDAVRCALGGSGSGRGAPGDEGGEGSGAPDVILMDVRMPRMNGIEATREILAVAPQVRIIVLTTFDLDEYALEGIQAGASGFLLKDARPEELLDAVRTVARGDAVIAPSTTRRLLSHLVSGAQRPSSGSSTPAAAGADAAPGSGAAVTAGAASGDGTRNAASSPLLGADVTVGPGGVVTSASAQAAAAGPASDPWQDPRLQSLTSREREVFELIGEGCSNGEIMQRLFLSEPTVKTHVSHILSKLQARDRVQAVVIAYETGVVLPG
ncbi:MULTISPECIES: response regulator transcription factor [Kocuria]|uniref:response regulator transcription factor n=1 Tax=Kocuria TaxID=57493 RepID=UPI00057DF381|nr:response regulator transcription factor [Kocuria rhizophila]KIC70422.1 NagC family transcriptional regulator [Kocuria rhizophila]WSQ06030.1 response regulator transcription factor [Kocuria rhizophila]